MIGLIATIENGEEHQFMEQLYKSYEHLMYATAIKYTSNRQIAEDVVQDSVERLICRVKTLIPMERCILAGYVVSTVKNVSINYLKAAQTKKRSYNVEDNLDEICSKDLPLDELMALSEQTDCLLKIWPSLSADDQLLLEGKYILGYSDVELANQVHCKASSIRMKLTRARKRALKLAIELTGVEQIYDEA